MKNRSNELAKKTVSFLIKHSFNSEPTDFETIYTYSQGRDQQLIAAVNDLVTSSTSDKSSGLNEIREKFIINGSRVEKVDKITDGVSTEINSISAMISSALSNASDYNEALGDVSKELNHDIDPFAIKSVVNTLIEATTEMEKQSATLQQKLEDSNSQINELNKNLKNVKIEARTDQLTGIGNRKQFDETLEVQIDLTNKNNSDLCVLIGDIDYFKKFNDTFGHQTGDNVLRFVAGTINETAKSPNVTTRYGGEEFAVILPGADLKLSLKVANNARIGVERKKLMKKSTGEDLGTITMSFGAAKYRKGETVLEFISRADKALYLAKETGRNRVMSELDL